MKHQSHTHPIETNNVIEKIFVISNLLREIKFHLNIIKILLQIT